MLAADQLLPTIKNFLRQIIPPVLATLIAALLIAGFNRAFSGHLVQPRMAALHSEPAVADETPRPAIAAAPAKPTEAATEVVLPTETIAPSQRVFAKDDEREAGKDQSPAKIAVPVVVRAPAAPRVAMRKAEPQPGEVRPVEPRMAAAPIPAAPTPAIAPTPAPVIAVAPAPAVAVAPVTSLPVMPPPGPAPQIVAQNPPPVIAAKPMVTVPDRPRLATEPLAEPDVMPQASQQRPFDKFVDNLRPSSIFARMREFGDRIEAAGNEILPSIRQ